VKPFSIIQQAEHTTIALDPSIRGNPDFAVSFSLMDVSGFSLMP